MGWGTPPATDAARIVRREKKWAFLSPNFGRKTPRECFRATNGPAEKIPPRRLPCLHLSRPRRLPARRRHAGPPPRKIPHGLSPLHPRLLARRHRLQPGIPFRCHRARPRHRPPPRPRLHDRQKNPRLPPQIPLHRRHPASPRANSRLPPQGAATSRSPKWDPVQEWVGSLAHHRTPRPRTHPRARALIPSCRAKSTRTSKSTSKCEPDGSAYHEARPAAPIP